MPGRQIHREFILNLKSIIPTGPQVAREALIVLGGLLVAAFIHLGGRGDPGIVGIAVLAAAVPYLRAGCRRNGWCAGRSDQ